MNYLDNFPLPEHQIPEVLKSLLILEDTSNPAKNIDITNRFEHNKYERNYEYLHMIMAAVPEKDIDSLETLSESTDGLVASSTPICRHKGDLFDIKYSISGFDYLVASWGDSLRFSFNLAEKVWMTMGLTPRLIGDSEQKIIFDDLTLPQHSVAEGIVSSEYHFTSSRDVKWTMRNDYLRRFLWMNGCCGVRVFFYEAFIERTKEVDELLNKSPQFNKDLGWCEVDIRTHDENILLQVWATVEAIKPDLCDELDVHSLIWAGHTKPMTKKRTQDIRLNEYLYVSDEFLVKYEKDNLFDAVPFRSGSEFYCSPSYKGQWSFRDCVRVGRNFVKMPFYELYRGVPDQEIYHVYQYAIPNHIAEGFDLNQEHIVLKANKLLIELISLGENLVFIGNKLNLNLFLTDIFEFNRAEYEAEGIRNYPIIQKLSHVAPSDMYEQDFLSRCKTINEIINKIKVGTLRKILKAMGVNAKDVSNLKTLKLLQGVLNLVEALNAQNEDADMLSEAASQGDWRINNSAMAPLFINNDLRNAEAHESVSKSIDSLTKLGLDGASLDSGYAPALDFMMDRIIDAFSCINKNIEKIQQ
ncbi:hypothetical protein P3384_12890 [Vibrio parahaemolyticus]|nr:hypothetical protein [Vibrio parahaemolyticus]MDF4465666.1 hypothetical protein [Vibrio parahaemolyticus]MDF4470412.1 hypothetical protein [Vibrio parahaemolyticus]MDF4492914.1 hypothetical protein [Vibrio parahaemolyticus]MDG2569282.1 hypothetical protein [Vibrio parahaemolyticus]